jgi:hypothetical protein
VNSGENAVENVVSIELSERFRKHFYRVAQVGFNPSGREGKMTQNKDCWRIP